jgi:hypothetical protein
MGQENAPLRRQQAQAMDATNPDRSATLNWAMATLTISDMMMAKDAAKGME